MIKRFTVLLFLLTSLCLEVGAQTPAPEGVHIKLSLADNKTVYRMGEPIKLVMERELIDALIKGKSWKLPAERVEELKKSCITQICKQSNLVRH